MMLNNVEKPKLASVSVDTLEPTIFHEPWWLEIATGGQCEVVDHGRVVGRMPYFPRRKNRLAVSTMPMLTHSLGPAIDEGMGKPSNRTFKRMEIATALIHKLPPLALFEQACHRNITEVLAFQANGFRASVQFTHEISLQSRDAVWKKMREKVRNSIELASHEATVNDDMDPGEFVSFCASAAPRRKGSKSLNAGQMLKLVEACVARGRGKVFAARGNDGSVICSSFCVWDNQTYYHLISTPAPEAQQGVSRLLMWEAITDAKRRGLTFDFNDVASDANAGSGGSFAAEPSPRYVVTRESFPVKLWRCAGSAAKLPNYVARCDEMS